MFKSWRQLQLLFAFDHHFSRHQKRYLIWKPVLKQNSNLLTYLLLLGNKLKDQVYLFISYILVKNHVMVLLTELDKSPFSELLCFLMREQRPQLKLHLHCVRATANTLKSCLFFFAFFVCLFSAWFCFLQTQGYTVTILEWL